MSGEYEHELEIEEVELDYEKYKDMEVPSYEEAMEGYVHAEPLPEEHESANARCHNCDEPWDEDKWKVRHINTPDTLGETWKYECPGCGEETFEVGI